MTNKEITVKTVLKTKANFENFIEEYQPAVITSTLAEYPKADGRTVLTICDLTQNINSLLARLNDPVVKNLPQAPLVVWLVTSEKEEVQNLVDIMNKSTGRDDIKTFIFKAALNDDESDIDIECILKPEFNERKYQRNDETPAKILQHKYWIKYSELSDRKITPAPRHFQSLSIGKGGVEIFQTVNTAKGYIATEILIRDDKTIFEKLLEHKEEIENELGELSWQKIEGKKSSRIRKTVDADISDGETLEDTIKAHIEMANEFKRVFTQYLN